MKPSSPSPSYAPIREKRGAHHVVFSVSGFLEIIFIIQIVTQPALQTGCLTSYALFDQDGDGHLTGADCNDRDPDIGPRYLDQDQDGFGLDDPMSGCKEQDGAKVSDQGGDCDDNNPESNPNQSETCDGEDNNCDGQADEGLQIVYYADKDQDNFGTDEDTEEGCTPPTGFTSSYGDCDDSDNTTYPGADEVCDGLDNNCDTQADEGLTIETYYPDEDHDGYGSSESGEDSCVPLENHVLNKDDCDDSAANVNPDATEICDGFDNDCNGERDDGFARPYLVDADGDGYGSTDERSCALVDGFVLARGDCNDSSAAAHPGATENIFDSTDSDCGGTTGAEPHVGISGTSFATLRGAIDAAQDGGTIFVGPPPEGLAYYEADLDFEGKAITLLSTHGPERTVIDAEGTGRIMAFSSGEDQVVVDGFTLANGCETTGGGAIHIDQASPTFKNCNIVRSLSDNGGGGIHLVESTATFENCIIAGNVGSKGGGIYVYSSSPRISACTVVFNRATDFGGGLLVAGGGNTVIDSSILAYNMGYNLYQQGTSENVSIKNSDLYNEVGPTHNLNALDNSNTELPPLFLGASNDGDIQNDDYHLAIGSSLRDAGNPDEGNEDPDGSRMEMGAFGGPDARWAYYVDRDSDGMYDGWEDAHALDPDSANETEDPDKDGASNLDEFQNRTDPSDSDSDGDGHTDGAELDTSSDPLDYYSQPNEEFPITVTIGHGHGFETIQEAIDRVQWTGTFEVKSATYEEEVQILGKRITLESESGKSFTLSAGEKPAISAAWSELNLSGANIEGNGSSGAGGLVLIGVSGELSGLTITNNIAIENGGGIALIRSDPTIRDSQLISNLAYEYGGGAYLYKSTPVFENVEFSGNLAAAGGGLAAEESRTITISSSTFSDNDVNKSGGGGIALFDSELSMSGSSVRENNAEEGGAGLFASSSDLALTSCDFSSNASSSGSGGAILLEASNADMEGGLFDSNLSELQGGGIALTGGSTLISSSIQLSANSSNSSSGGGMSVVEDSQVQLNASLMEDNLSALSGGALYSENSTLTLSQCTLSGNEAGDFGGGMSLFGSQTVLAQTLVSDNNGYQSGAIHLDASSAQVSSTLITGNTSSGTGGGLALLNGSDLVMRNSSIVENATMAEGGGLYIEDSWAELEFLTLVNNLSYDVLYGNPPSGIFVSLGSDHSVTLNSTILAYNTGYNLYLASGSSGELSLTYSDLYNTGGAGTNTSDLGGTNFLGKEPKFLSYSDGSPDDVHLALDSPLKDAGDPKASDEDGSPADIGTYGGSDGGARDLDNDGFPDYFWPGQINDAPSPYKAEDYDCDDLDPSVHTGCK